MTDAFPGLDIETFATPKAGLFLWAKLPVKSERAEVLATQAPSRGIWLARGSDLTANENPSSWFRFNAATSNEPELWDFLLAV